MLAEHRTVRTKKQRSAIQRAVFSLDYTDYDVLFVVGGNLA
jgi:hypothetical protein